MESRGKSGEWEGVKIMGRDGEERECVASEMTPHCVLVSHLMHNI